MDGDAALTALNKDNEGQNGAHERQNDQQNDEQGSPALTKRNVFTSAEGSPRQYRRK